MKRTRIHPTDEQRRRLAIYAQATGLSEAQLVRRILDNALGIEDREELLAAFDAGFGVCEDYPPWEEWLSDVRGKGDRSKAATPRLGWAEAAAKMAERGEDELLD
jgi:hypothetical protein